MLIFCFVRSATSIEHDSICNEEDGSCPEPIHTVIRLARRDDELARRIAAEHGMEVRVRLVVAVALLFRVICKHFGSVNADCRTASLENYG